MPLLENKNINLYKLFKKNYTENLSKMGNPLTSDEAMCYSKTEIETEFSCSQHGALDKSNILPFQ